MMNNLAISQKELTKELMGLTIGIIDIELEDTEMELRSCQYKLDRSFLLKPYYKWKMKRINKHYTKLVSDYLKLKAEHEQLSTTD